MGVECNCLNPSCLVSKYIGVLSLLYPQKIINEIEAIMRHFLWTEADLKHSGEKVKWEHVSAPKEEGGLGFRLLKDWNKATMQRDIWDVCNTADTLW